jgi:hypothetical protein
MATPPPEREKVVEGIFGTSCELLKAHQVALFQQILDLRKHHTFPANI